MSFEFFNNKNTLFQVIIKLLFQIIIKVREYANTFEMSIISWGDREWSNSNKDYIQLKFHVLNLVEKNFKVCF